MDLLLREELLDEAAVALAAADEGRGRLLAIAGEAGVGKSMLVRTFLDRQSTALTLRVGACDPLATPRPLGPLVDLATDGTPLAEALAADAAPVKTFPLLLNELRAAPTTTVLVIEDVHWAD